MLADLILAGVDPITLAVGVGLSILAGMLLKPKINNPFDDSPTPLATRGTFVPYIRGVRKVSFVHALAGGRRTVEEKVEGGKGSDLFSGPKQTVYYEHGLHVLAVGPIFALHEIYQGGTKIFTGPITSSSHPSGSTVDLGQEGSFRIYWGEKDQPIDTFLADAARIGISSRWPLYCYIVWNDKRLGASPRWQQLQYVLEGRVQETGLVDTTAYMAGTQVNEGATIAIDDGLDGIEGTGRFRMLGYHADRLEIGEEFIVAGNADSGTKTVFKVESSIVAFNVVTDVFPVGGVSGSDDAGTVQPRESQQDDGVNLAHVIWELLFAQAPYGLARDQSEWDIPSLEALGTLLVTEGIKGSVIGANGQDVEGLLGSILQDIGVQVPVNYTTGKVEFVPMRKPVGLLPDIKAEHILPPLPEREQFLGEKPTDSIVWAFQDRELNLTKNTIFIDDLGQAEQLNHKRFREVPIESTVNFDVAALIGNRRELEEFTSKSKTNLATSGDTRTLKPGDAVTANGFGDVLRVWGTKIDPLSGDVKLKVSPDFYGVALDTFTNSKPGVTSSVAGPALDLAQSILEVPTGLLPSVPDQAIVVPRIRAHNAINGAFIHLSLDDTTFQFATDEIKTQTGGTLNAELPATGLSHTDEIEFSVLGPDISSVLDLTLDEANWRLGRQLLVIGDEIMYVRSITSLGGDDYRANDVLRARHCTTKATHAINTPVFIFQNDGITPVKDILLQPDDTIYVKAQPRAGSPVPLASVPSDSKALHGEGRKPPDPRNLQVTAPTSGQRNEYSTTDDITIGWSICLPSTDAQGAGSIGAGNAVAATPIKGEFTIDWTTVGAPDVIQRTDVVADVDTFTLTNAQLSTAFTGEPATLKAKIRSSALGLDSRTIEITITKT